MPPTVARSSQIVCILLLSRAAVAQSPTNNGDQDFSRASRGARLAGGAIAGIVIACIALVILLTLIGCCMLARRRRGAGRPAPFGGFGGGRFGGFGGRGPMSGPATGLAGNSNRFNYAGAQESAAAPGMGPGPQGGWNTAAEPAYQPPAGAPPGMHGAPHPGGFVRPEEAHTKPF